MSLDLIPMPLLIFVMREKEGELEYVKSVVNFNHFSETSLVHMLM